MQEEVVKRLESFLKKYKNAKFKNGEILIEADTNPAGLFYLKEGIVKQCAISKKGDEQTINIFKAPSLFPIAWIINDSINSYYFESTTSVSVYIAPKQEALTFLKNEPQVLFDLLQRIYRGLDGYFVRMEILLHGGARERLISELVIYAKRFGEQKEDKTLIKLNLTERQLAAQSGIARETVSRELQKLQRENLINFQKNTLTINNLQQLQEMIM